MLHLVLNAPPEVMLGFAQLTVTIHYLVQPAEIYATVLVFINSSNELPEYATIALAAANDASRLWFAYLKKPRV